MVTALQIARGDSSPLVQETPSPIASISSSAWGRFLRAMTTRDLDYVSPTGSLGCFEMRPQRLGDLGVMVSVHCEMLAGKRVWRGDFKPPETQVSFLGSYPSQYSTFVRSVRDHLNEIEKTDLPSEMTVSGELAILHRAGFGGLSSWIKGRRFDDTIALFRRTNGIF